MRSASKPRCTSFPNILLLISFRESWDLFKVVGGGWMWQVASIRRNPFGPFDHMTDLKRDEFELVPRAMLPLRPTCRLRNTPTSCFISSRIFW